MDTLVADEPTRDAIKGAYFERLIVSDLGRLVRKAVEGRDPATGAFFDAMADFLAAVPRSIVAHSDHLFMLVMWPPARHWPTLPSSARRPYRRMLRLALRADPWSPRVLPPYLGRRAIGAISNRFGDRSP